ncbi:hypothetical protein PTSG_04379 [Salpingoeca rosetta]|uniref:Uncharacterized protein n=1 Tax=Salpingoeca rosetta (strain ATCC 50818 / BSB-021) TaxID=946362 RepID=F2U8D6_SALR5|nr:uncharacterized protein PTSG_04379 [Salpingoeca rosetta]EGD72644.1 hypothetical protein PTSG_04379 [Salpingoeca rosetta]|eukprot:XP_004994467.1 hypothetical protein PTSG_04379 [Salpingoeca rosetta]
MSSSVKSFSKEMTMKRSGVVVVVVLGVVVLGAVVAPMIVSPSSFSFATMNLHPSASQVRALRGNTANGNERPVPTQLRPPPPRIGQNKAPGNSSQPGRQEHRGDSRGSSPNRSLPPAQEADVETTPEPTCRPGRDAHCDCPPDCHECRPTQQECVMCRNSRFLHQGQCIDECPNTLYPIGQGQYGKYCGEESDTQKEGVNQVDILQLLRERARQHHEAVVGEGGADGEGADGRSADAGTRAEASSCTCTDCVEKSCVCNADGTTQCMLCKNFKYLLNGQCVDDCPATGAYTAIGTSRFGRKCKPRGAGGSIGTGNGFHDLKANPPPLERPLQSEHAKHATTKQVDVGLDGEGKAKVHVIAWGLDHDQIQAATINIAVGDTVRWIIDGRHSVISGRPGQHDAEFFSGPPGSKTVFEHTFTKAGATIIVGNPAKDKAERDWQYVLMFEGAGGSTDRPQRFETAMKEEFTVFRAKGVTLRECQARCGADTICKGVFYYRQSRRCKGLASLGTAGVPTEIKADSYAKVHSMHPIQTAH